MLRISHSAVVGAWREREWVVRRLGIHIRLLSAKSWNEGGGNVPLVPDEGEDVVGVSTLGTHPILFLFDPRPIWRELGQQWDVIDIHEEPYALATAEILFLRWLRRQQAPFVVYSAQNINKKYPIPFRWLERWVLRNAAALSACNTDAIRIAVSKGLRGHAAYIPLGVDTTRFSPGSDIERVAPLCVVGYVGRLEAHKGVEVLLEAVAGDPTLSLRIAGGGPSEHSLRVRASSPDLRGRVQFLGHVGQHELTKFYRELAVLAVPSLPTAGWLEQFCRVAVEAMASGVPVVASRSGALPEVVGTAGLLVPPNNAVALRDAIGRLCTETELATRVRNEGLSRAADFSWNRVGNDYERLYRSIICAEPPSDDTTTTWTLGDTSGGGRMDVEVIVVAYGTPELFARAIAPLAGRFPVTVVDNSASPSIKASTEAVGGRYLDPGSNLGFGAGVNQALAHRQYPRSDVLLLNPDAVIDARGVEHLHQHLHAKPGLACVGPAQIDAEGVPARVLWPFPSPSRAWLDAFGLSRGQSAASYVIGSVLLINADALENVGGFDERFFLYAEETDWEYRAHRAGWSHEVVHSVMALHLGAGSGGDPLQREVIFHASNELYLRKHFGRTGWQFARAGVVVGALGRSLVLPPGRREAARRRMMIYVRGPARTRASFGSGR